MTTLSDDFQDSLVEMVADTTFSTSLFSRYARAKLQSFPEGLTIGESPIKAHPILLAMLDRAPSDQGKRYVACAGTRPILYCQGTTLAPSSSPMKQINSFLVSQTTGSGFYCGLV